MTFIRGHPGYRLPDSDRLETKPCNYCKKNFTNYKSNYRKFCSNKCRHDFKKGKLPEQLKRTLGHLKGNKHPNWKGGKFIDTNGYVWVRLPNESYKTMQKPYIYEHRIIMEQHLGREIKKGEIIHHLNGNRSDNKLENLRLVSNHSKHMKTFHIR